MTLRLSRHASLAFALLVAVGCAGRLPAPESAVHAREAYLPVPYPPPAGLAETVTPEPERGGAVWIDGEWAFQGRTYVWQRGGWVYPPRDASFAPWRALYQSDGRLFLAPGTWYDRSGKPLPRPDAAVPATTPPNEATPESQTGR